ncbi:MAG: RNA polymerase sigma factor RpoD/SigA [Bacteroidales bacterium]|jgi:RNA polymerase primary sigma factor|nr:RNA polymerase sigma factor RpoD/SigA [Bacteroidales bacterium]
MEQLKITPAITLRTPTLEQYMRDISRIEMISPDEETELAMRIKEGDTQALNSLVNANLRFVVSVAKQYQNRGLDLTDLISEGNIGLIKAAQKFDPTRGFKFISYAVWWIRQQILSGISQDSHTIRLPMNQIGLQIKASKKKQLFVQDHEREPTDEELAAIMETDISRISEINLSGNSTVSLSKPLGDDDSQTLEDVVADTQAPQVDSKLLKESLLKDLEEALQVLGERERQIISSSFGIGCPAMTLEEIGENMDLTRERVRQIRSRALRTLSSPRIKRRLAQYLQ